MKKLAILATLSLMCCMLQGCTSTQKISLADGVEAELLTVGIPKEALGDNTFKPEYDEIDFLFEVENTSESIFDVDEEVLSESIIPINQDGEIEADLHIFSPTGFTINPKETGDIIISLSTMGDSESIGFKVEEQKVLVNSNDEKIQVYDFEKVEKSRNSITYESEDMSITFNAETQDNDELPVEQRCAECSYTIENKTDRPLIIPEISIETATEYNYGGNVSGPDWIGSDWKYDPNGADELMQYIDESVRADNANEKNKEEKDKIVAENDILGYLREGQDLSMEEVNELINILNENEIYLDTNNTYVVTQKRLEPKEKITEESTLVIDAIGSIIKTNIEF